MTERIRKLTRFLFGSKRRLASNLAVVAAALVLGFSLFPGRRLPMAFAVGTGLGTSILQKRIDKLEAKAIARETFSRDEKMFLRDFYATLATGAKLSIIVGQTGRMMDHYLVGSGKDFRLEPEIFRENTKVRIQMELLRRRAGSCAEKGQFESPVFYMPDKSKVDSVFGLYFGRVRLSTQPMATGGCRYLWRAEVPWQWPSYPSLKKKYGRYHAESFPLPNALSLLLGKRHALFVDNGLGEYLTHLGLAKVFLAYAQWTE